jgi:hypothetical protein
VIKGNVNRSGECIYHEPGGRWYSKINMDLSKGKRWFCSVAEAEAAGCRAPKLCRVTSSTIDVHIDEIQTKFLRASSTSVFSHSLGHSDCAPITSSS